MEDSVLELWAEDGDFNTNTMEQLTDQEIIDTINTRNKSGIFNIEKNFLNLLSDVKYNSSGHIVGAGVATIGKEYQF